MTIRNVVFDFGNVLVRWDPHGIVASVLPDVNPVEVFSNMREVWLDLNLGKYSEEQAKLIYQETIGITAEQATDFMNVAKTTQTPIPGSFELLERLHQAKVPLYSITDNIHEIMDYHRENSNFLYYFAGIIVSAELGILKPDPRIYQQLLDEYHLKPEETVFIDDLIVNVEGARAVGMHAFQFIDAASCEATLIDMGIDF